MSSAEQRYRAFVWPFPAFQPGYLHPVTRKNGSKRAEASELLEWRRRLDQEEALWPVKPREKLSLEPLDNLQVEAPLPSPSSSVGADAPMLDTPALSISQSQSSFSSISSVQTQSSSSSQSTAFDLEEEDHLSTPKKQRRGARGRRGVKAEKLRFA